MLFTFVGLGERMFLIVSHTNLSFPSWSVLIIHHGFETASRLPAALPNRDNRRGRAASRDQ